MRILAIQTNSEGRPCGWGLVTIKSTDGEEVVRGAVKQAAQIAGEQYDKHCCYPEEKKGTLFVKHLHDEGGDQS